jgi:hypothetical protein
MFRTSPTLLWPRVSCRQILKLQFKCPPCFFLHPSTRYLYSYLDDLYFQRTCFSPEMLLIWFRQSIRSRPCQRTYQKLTGLVISWKLGEEDSALELTSLSKLHPSFYEFLTKKTTCASEMSKKTTCKKKLSKRTTSQWRHVWPGDTCHVPPGPNSASPCRHPQRRHVGWRRSVVGPAAIAIAGTCRASANMPALGMAARACRIWPRRHVTRVAWPDVPTLRRGPFWQFFSQVVLFNVSVIQMVLFVKTSLFTNLCTLFTL